MQNLTKEKAYKALQGFFEANPNPFVFFGTGTSCGVDARFGMASLRDYLLHEMPKRLNVAAEKIEWQAVDESLKTGCDFEKAMDAIKDTQVTHHVANATADFLGSLDREYSCNILCGNVSWPSIKLFKQLVAGLSASDSALHVATTNYDLLAEYAFEHLGISYINGYVGGVFGVFNGKKRSIYSVSTFQPKLVGKNVSRVLTYENHIRLYKVHGSLNTFKLNGEIVENNSWMYGPPLGIDRVMVTPGTGKYEKLHQHRFDLLNTYDKALETHNAFIFVGFGFNDNQITNDCLSRKLKDQCCPCLIVTRDSNPRIEAVLEDCENAWLVCKSGNGTLIKNKRYTNYLQIPNKELWNATGLATEILGG